MSIRTIVSDLIEATEKLPATAPLHPWPGGHKGGKPMPIKIVTGPEKSLPYLKKKRPQKPSWSGTSEEVYYQCTTPRCNLALKRGGKQVCPRCNRVVIPTAYKTDAGYEIPQSLSQTTTHAYQRLPSGAVVRSPLRRAYVPPVGSNTPTLKMPTAQAPTTRLPPHQQYRAMESTDKIIESMLDSMVEAKPKKKGDCYEAAGRYMMDRTFSHTPDLFLVHGEVQGQGKLAGVRFGHAWVEEGDTVVDTSNGRDLHLPKAVYYAIGDIKRTRRYDMDEFRRMVTEFAHWGPWDFETEM